MPRFELVATVFFLGVVGGAALRRAYQLCFLSPRVLGTYALASLGVLALVAACVVLPGLLGGRD